MKRLLFCLSLFSVFFFEGYFLSAQSADVACRRNLDVARGEFRKGNLYAVEALLVKCLKSGFEKQERIEAYKLLVITFLYIKQDEKAESYLVQLLKLDPLFSVKPGIDPDQLVYLLKEFNTDPFLYVGGSIFINRANYSALNTIELSGVNINSEPETSGRFNFSGNLHVTIPLSNYDAIGVNLGVTSFGYDIVREVHTSQSTSGATQSVTYEENSTVLNFDGYYELTPRKKSRVVPYANLGGGVTYLLSTSMGTISRSKNPDFPSQPITAQTYDLLSFRRRVNFYGNLNVGVRLNQPKFAVKIFGGFTQFLLPHSQYSSESERFDNELIYDLGIIENDYRASFFSLGVSLQMSYYNFVKKKKFQ